MFNNRKNQLLAFILDFVLYSFIFSTDYYDSIFLNILKFGFWISISYVFNKYNFTETKLIDIFKRQIICCLLCLAFILGIKNVINLFIENYFLFQLKDLIKLIFFSFLINSLLNLYLNPSKDLNRKWFFVGSKERFYVLQNKLKICNENLNVFLFNKSNLNKINKNSFLIIDDYSDNSENLENLKNLPQINKIKLDHWFEKILKRYPSDLISDNLLRELQISKIMNTFEYKLKSLIERFVALILLLVSSPIILLTLIVVFFWRIDIRHYFSRKEQE